MEQVFGLSNWSKFSRSGSFKSSAYRTSNRKYFFLTVEISHYSIITDRRNIFDQPIKNDVWTYEDTRKIATGQGDD